MCKAPLSKALWRPNKNRTRKAIYNNNIRSQQTGIISKMVYIIYRYVMYYYLFIIIYIYYKLLLYLLLCERKSFVCNQIHAFFISETLAIYVPILIRHTLTNP